MEVEEPWEALDADDTDLSSSTTTSLLRRCTTQPRLSLLPPEPPQQPPPSPPPHSTTTRRLIPGPAAAIQATMHRNNRFKSTTNRNRSPVISTQEYIRRAEEDSGEEFSRNPWVFVLCVLRTHGFIVCVKLFVVDITPLSAIKKCLNADRFDKVVAIVKSCAPNGLGDMMITLKDPTVTISASVHGKVLSVGEFGRLITVGSVLVLQKVVSFSSSCTSCCLNITRSNIAKVSKVVSVDCEVQDFTEGNLDNPPVFGRNLVIPEKNSTLVSKRTGIVVGDVQRSSSSKGKAVIVELTETENCTQPSNLCGGRQVENAADRIFKEPIHADLGDSGQSAMGCYSQRQGGNSGRSSQPGSGSLEGIVKNLQYLDNNEKHRQVRELSSAPSMIENLGDRNWQASVAQDKRLLQGSYCNMSSTEKTNTVVHAPVGTSSRMPNNVDDLDVCDVNNVQKQQQLRGISSVAGMVENQAKRNMSEIIGGLKSMQQTETGANSIVVEKQDDQEPRSSNGVKKQRVALISRAAVQEWTDEQLCILDMDDD